MNEYINSSHCLLFVITRLKLAILFTHVIVTDTACILRVTVWSRQCAEAESVVLLTIPPSHSIVSYRVDENIGPGVHLCCMDYCNYILKGMSDGLLRWLQSIQKAGVRLFTGARWCEHITPILCELHWLPWRQSVPLKIARFHQPDSHIPYRRLLFGI